VSSAAHLRLLKFSLVGGIGIGVQLGALAALTSMKLNYLLATALAVECALIHNFLWHRRFTWADRVASGMRDSLSSLFRFHTSNGLISLVGNLLLMRLLVRSLGWPVLPANLATIALCFVANFLASDRWVFFLSPAGRSNTAVPLRISEPSWSAPASTPACAARTERRSGPP
jgi:putative flippase GtrA